MSLRIIPVTLEVANAFVRRLHRHNKPVVGAKFCVGVQAEQLVGVAIVGRPVAPKLDDGLTAEITRVCTDGTRNAASMLIPSIHNIGTGRTWWRVTGATPTRRVPLYFSALQAQKDRQ